MLALVLGLLIFLSIHSLGYLAPDWRDRQRAANPLVWRVGHSLASVLGLVLIIWGYGQARLEPHWLWVSPMWTRHLAALLTVPAFILLAAAWIPGTHIKARVGHPLLLGVKFWALAHLFANGTLADVFLFGGFLAWAVPGFVLARRRDRALGIRYPAVSGLRDVFAVALGLVLWVVFAMMLHKWLIGVAPFARVV